MTIEVLKSETSKLSKIEKLEFLQFLAEQLSKEERSLALSREQEKTLLRRQNEVKSGKTSTISADKVKANIIKKHGLQT